jgi:hypothetical protein
MHSQTAIAAAESILAVMFRQAPSMKALHVAIAPLHVNSMKAHALHKQLRGLNSPVASRISEMGMYDGDIIFDTEPSYNHPDVARGSIDTDEETMNGKVIDAWTMVCNALIAPNGNVHYVEDYNHDDVAYMLGFEDKEVAISNGYIHLSLNNGPFGITNTRHATEEQIDALNMMFAFAKGASDTWMVKTFIRTYIHWATINHIDVEA